MTLEANAEEGAAPVALGSAVSLPGSGAAAACSAKVCGHLVLCLERASDRLKAFWQASQRNGFSP